MNFRSLSSLVTLALGATLSLGAQQSTSAGSTSKPGTPFVFSGVNVVDVKTGKVLTGQNVVISGGHIKAIGPEKKVKIPKGAQVVDAKGKYLIPGMWDMHPHVDAAARILYPKFLAHGVTGLRDMAQRFPHGSDSFYVWQKEVLSGQMAGPRVIGPSADLTYNMRLRTPEDAKRIMDSLKEAKVAFIKFHDSMMRDKELFFAIMREARRVGIPVVGHVSRFIPNVVASDSGMHSIEHIEENHQCWPTWPKLLGDSAAADARCAPMVQAYIKNGTWMMVGLNGHWLDDQYRPDKEKGLWEDEKRFVRLLYRLGFRRFITGTDWAPVFAGWDKRFLPGLSAVEDLATYNIDAGFSTLEALQTGTLNPAKSLGLEDSLGSVEVGKLADLVLLDGDPLVNIRNVFQVRGVMVNGFYHNREQLTAMDPIGTRGDQGLIAAREGKKPAPAPDAAAPAASSQATPAPVAPAQSGNPTVKEMADTTQPVLTKEHVEQLLKFLRATMAEWEKPEVAEFYQLNLTRYPIAIGNIGGDVPDQLKDAAMPLPDMEGLANKFPSIKTALTAANLTGQQYMTLHRAIICAHVTDVLDRLRQSGQPATTVTKDTTTIVGKNVEFLRANPQAIPDLQAALLDLPQLQTSQNQ